MTIRVSEPNVLLDLTAGALRTVAEAIVGALTFHRGAAAMPKTQSLENNYCLHDKLGERW